MESVDFMESRKPTRNECKSIYMYIYIIIDYRPILATVTYGNGFLASKIFYDFHQLPSIYEFMNVPLIDRAQYNPKF